MLPALTIRRVPESGANGREAQQACYDLISDWTSAEHQALRQQVPKDALQTPFRSSTVQVRTLVGLWLHSRRPCTALLRQLCSAKRMLCLHEPIAGSNLACSPGCTSVTRTHADKREPLEGD